MKGHYLDDHLFKLLEIIETLKNILSMSGDNPYLILFSNGYN